MKTAYVTLLTAGDAYLPGIETLGQSLRNTRTSSPFVVMVTPDISAETRAGLLARGLEIEAIEPIHNPRPDTELLYPRFAHTYTKLRAFDLARFDKIVLLDADTLVMRNIDDLFERPAIAAASDFFMPDRFNSGVMVLDPSHELFGKLMTALAQAATYDGGDQGFLNSYWPDWWAMPVEHRLPIGYNIHHFIFQFMHAHPVVGARLLEETRVLHYTLQKPWMGAMVTGGADAWWNQFYGAHPEKDRSWLRRLHELEDWSFERVVGALGG